MADTVITFTIPEAKVQRVVAAQKGLYPIPVDGNGDQLFTDNQWAKESLRRHVINDVHRYETKLAKDAATAAKDDSLIV